LSINKYYDIIKYKEWDVLITEAYMKTLFLFSSLTLIGMTAVNAYPINVACPVLNPQMFIKGPVTSPKDIKPHYTYNFAHAPALGDIILTLNASVNEYKKLSVFHFRSTLVGHFSMFDVLHNLSVSKTIDDIRIKGIDFVKAEVGGDGRYVCLYKFSYENLIYGPGHNPVKMVFKPSEGLKECKVDNNGKGFICEVK